MKHRAAKFFAALLAAIFTHAAFPARAQLLPDGAAERVPFFAAALTPILAESRDFTARAQWIFFANAAEGRVVTPMTLATSRGRMRWELNLEDSPREQFLPGAVATLKRMKMERITLYLQTGRAVQVAFPGAESVVALPLPKDQAVTAKADDKAAQLAQTAIARETLDGHPCVKFRLTVPVDKKSSEEAFVWRATDLGNFPLRIEIRFGDESHVLRFGTPNFVKLDDRHFAPPGHFTRHPDLESLLQSSLLRGLGLQTK
jgi:hypothetical protein